MPTLRGLTVAVGELYAATLAVCLPAALRHLAECLVVTAPGNAAVRAVAESSANVRVFETNAFYEHGAMFNKGLACELAFDVLGRDGWILVWDSDIVLPAELVLDGLDPACIHGLRRRVLADPACFGPELDWRSCPVHRDGPNPIGYFQLFHAAAAALRDVRPWYDVSFPHAGGCDAHFLNLWPRRFWRMLPGECLHLGRPDVNWFGTSPQAQDLMAKFVHQNGWRTAMAQHSPEAVARAGALPGRLAVPGYPPSQYELPFVARTERRLHGV